MTIHAKNFIAGEWVESKDHTQDLNPSNTKDVVGEYPRASAADAERAIAAAKAAFPAWSRSSIQERHDILKRIGDEILARKDELGKLLSREEGKTLVEGVGETVRAAQIFLFFAGEVPAAGRRESSLDPSRRRCRDHARAARRHRPHHAVEFPDRHSGLEDRARARLRQLRGVQAGRSRAGDRACPVRDHREGRHAGRRVQSRHGPRLGGRRGDAQEQGHHGDLLHRLGRDRPQDRGDLRRIRVR